MATAEQRLAALRLHGTKYEAVVVRADGSRCLLGYLGRHSRQGLISAARQRWSYIWDYCQLGADGTIGLGVGLGLATSNGCRIEFSGRTQREAISRDSELVYVRIAAAPVAPDAAVATQE
jgi:hypothetical protein